MRDCQKFGEGFCFSLFGRATLPILTGRGWHNLRPPNHSPFRCPIDPPETNGDRSTRAPPEEAAEARARLSGQATRRRRERCAEHRVGGRRRSGSGHDGCSAPAVPEEPAAPEPAAPYARPLRPARRSRSGSFRSWSSFPSGRSSTWATSRTRPPSRGSRLRRGRDLQRQWRLPWWRWRWRLRTPAQRRRGPAHFPLARFRRLVRRPRWPPALGRQRHRRFAGRGPPRLRRPRSPRWRPRPWPYGQMAGRQPLARAVGGGRLPRPPRVRRRPDHAGRRRAGAPRAR